MPEESVLGGISNATAMVVKFGTVRHTILLWYFRANYNIIVRSPGQFVIIHFVTPERHGSIMR